MCCDYLLFWLFCECAVVVMLLVLVSFVCLLFGCFVFDSCRAFSLIILCVLVCLLLFCFDWCVCLLLIVVWSSVAWWFNLFVIVALRLELDILVCCCLILFVCVCIYGGRFCCLLIWFGLWFSW